MGRKNRTEDFRELGFEYWDIKAGKNRKKKTRLWYVMDPTWVLYYQDKIPLPPFPNEVSIRNVHGN